MHNPETMVERKSVSDIGWEVGPFRGLLRYLNLVKSEFVKVEKFDEEEFKEVLINTFENTSKELWLSTDLDPYFYGDEDIKNSILGVPDSADIKIILDREVDVEERSRDEDTSWAFCQENIDISQSNESIPYWIISDNRDVVLEDPRDPNPEMGPYTVFRDLDTSASKIVKEKFNNWLDNADPISR